jgi:hypothetical protein
LGGGGGWDIIGRRRGGGPVFAMEKAALVRGMCAAALSRYGISRLCRGLPQIRRHSELPEDYFTLLRKTNSFSTIM